MSFGFLELGMILLIIVFCFGPSKLPKLGSSAGEALKNFKDGLKGVKEVKDSDVKEVDK